LIVCCVASDSIGRVVADILHAKLNVVGQILTYTFVADQMEAAAEPLYDYLASHRFHLKHALTVKDKLDVLKHKSYRGAGILHLLAITSPSFFRKFHGIASFVDCEQSAICSWCPMCSSEFWIFATLAATRRQSWISWKPWLRGSNCISALSRQVVDWSNHRFGLIAIAYVSSKFLNGAG